MPKYISVPPTPIANLDMEYISRMVTAYQEQMRLHGAGPCPSPIVEAALALQEAVANKDISSCIERTQEDIDASIAKAKAALEYARKSGSVGWGVKRANWPTDTRPGQVVRINYMGYGPAIVFAEIHSSTSDVHGTSLVLKLLETQNSFNLGKCGWIYVGFWMPKYPTAQGGFTLRDAPKPLYSPQHDPLCTM